MPDKEIEPPKPKPKKEVVPSVQPQVKAKPLKIEVPKKIVEEETKKEAEQASQETSEVDKFEKIFPHPGYCKGRFCWVQELGRMS